MKLQVLICTKGMEGINRIASLPHPQMKDVGYLVSWQEADMQRIPAALRSRTDFKIVPSNTLGLSKNRNNALAFADADLVLISDDDLLYTEKNLQEVIDNFYLFPDHTFLTFRFKSVDYPRSYPYYEFDMSAPPKGYFTVSMELALNLGLMHRKRLNIPTFNENFGIGAPFGSGEEDILIKDLLRQGHKGRFIPVDVCEHPGPTTCVKNRNSDNFIQTKGAVMSYIKPFSWPLRMLLYARRESQALDSDIDFCSYVFNFLKGVRKARKLKVFGN